MRRPGIALVQSLILVAAAALVTMIAPTPAGAAAAITVNSRLNGNDADIPPGYPAAPGQTLGWSIQVTNTGDAALTAVVVTDNHGLTVTCPKASLEPGETMTCTAAGTAIAGLHQHIATATADAAGTAVSDDDSTWYSVDVYPGVGLETLVNGEDADTPPGPGIPAGSSLLWTFVVTNTGNMALTSVAVVTDAAMVVVCPKTTLEPGESMTCAVSSTAIAGPQAVLGTATGTWHQALTVSDDDPAYYSGRVPQVGIETMINGFDADTAPGPEILAGSPLGWTYVVTNTGGLTLTSVTVTDDQGHTVTCPKTSLAPGESMTCTATSTALAGPHGLVGSVSAGSLGGSAWDDDPAWYTGISQGCPLGYWKKHTDAWPPTGYSPAARIGTVFSASVSYPSVANATLRDALGFKGGPGPAGAAKTLLRAATAALLNAAHPNIDYPRTVAAVLASVDTALASGNRTAMLTLASQLDADNNGACPLG